MCDWIVLATSWRRDGTPAPDRRLVTHLLNGDPLAIAYVSVILIAVVGCALYKFLHKH